MIVRGPGPQIDSRSRPPRLRALWLLVGGTHCRMVCTWWYLGRCLFFYLVVFRAVWFLFGGKYSPPGSLHGLWEA